MPHINISYNNPNNNPYNNPYDKPYENPYDNSYDKKGDDEENNNFVDIKSYGFWIVCWIIVMFSCCFIIASYNSYLERNRRIYEIKKKENIIKEKLNEFNQNKFNFSSEIECSICSLNFDNQDVIILDCCNNYFHHDCIKDWYLKSINKDCPLCRSKL